jgi:UDP-N-acetylglucosamine transferase subunit ALG13
LIQKFEVLVAATGDQKILLQREFPHLLFVELPGYHIKYDKNRAFTFFRMIGSIPKILIRVKEEHRWLRHFKDQERLDAVISDNRYGLWGEGLYSVLITHQLGIRTSLGPWMDRWVQRLHYRLIGRFSAVWVPDQEEGMGLAGALSHPQRMPSPPVRYVGILSRMTVQGEVEAGEGEVATIDLLIVLSGPEPQRTILEKRIWAQLSDFRGSVVFVRGLPSGGEVLKEAANVRVYDHLPAQALNEVMVRARLVLARAGYSTVMDLVRLGKRSVLIPTPGQTEQEYLGRYLTEKRIALCVRQAGFSLTGALQRADRFHYVTIEEKGDLLGDVIAQSFSPVDLG